LPEGAEHDGTDDDGNDRFRVTIPLDEHGFFGRECPSCNRPFLVSKDSYDPLPDDLRLWCVYCGHDDDHSEFMTTQQKARIMSLMEDVGMQMISQSLDQSFGRLARNSRNNSFVRFEYRPSRVYPRPLPGIQEEQLIRERSCAGCGMRYAVFGEHRYCPVCGLIPAGAVALDALAAETSRLDVLAGLPGETVASLREQGLLDRQYVDTIENVVGVVESVAAAVFRERVPDSATLMRGKGNVFQRLDDLADLFLTHLAIDVRAACAGGWPELQRTWAGRHVYAHHDGTVDERYLRSVPTSPLRLGQRLPVREQDARRAVELVRLLVEAVSAAPFGSAD
jgi:hypothetical protein